ncbi:MAG TPA: protein kinase [Polyangiaceae bacterium]|nr:protein kinase [Polyangiaceae bacterium]
MANVPGRAFDANERSRPRLRALPALPRPGDTIAGKYALVGLIGEGGMGVVFEATHLRLHQRVAIKILRPDLPEFHTVVARFEREARAAAQLQSIHTARVIDVDALPNGLPYIVLEFLEGRDLDAELEATGPMPVEDAVDIVQQVTEAMSEAHALGIVHRDLKPSNLFVCRVGERGRRVVKVLDFGISKTESEDARLTPSHEYFGTPYYAAPEQLRAACTADARSDVWSLGSILFELLTGRTPFIGTPTSVIAKVVSEPVPWPTELRPELPRDLARIVMRALQRDPQQRFQNMRQLGQALEPFAPQQSIAEAVAEAPRGRGKLGEILIADGLLTPPDLERALIEQRRSGKLLGRALLDLRLVSQVDLLTALAKQQGVIVTPEVPSPTERELRQREAPTAPPSTTVPRPRAWWRQPWVAAAVVGLPVGIAAAAGLASTLNARAKATGLVATTSARTPLPIMLAPPSSSAKPDAIPAAPTTAASAAPAPGAPPTRSARTPAPRSRSTFDPSGI